MHMDDHPCFNAKAHHRFGRVHLPVAPRCNIQCKFCNRLFDCVNESRPGVTSALLSPAQAMIYLKAVLKEKPNIRVVGIAGPGDPFANADETLETLRRVRRDWPEMILCVATNGLNLAPYLDDLARLKVSHVTLTINAVDARIGARIYSWMRIDKRVVDGQTGAGILLERQLAAIAELRQRDIMVKVNSIVLPGINDTHIVEVARKVSALGANLFNCMPYYPNAGSTFENLPEPDSQAVAALRQEASRHIRQMGHCTRCRADAVGLLGEAPSPSLTAALKNCQHLTCEPSQASDIPRRPFVAVASMEGVLVNQHLGEARQVLIYGEKEGRIGLIEARPTPRPGGGVARWRQLAECLDDCRALLVSGVGESPTRVLRQSGVAVHTCEGLIDEAVRRVFAGQNLDPLAPRQASACGAGCSGNMLGCG
jgi:nitrogen fixation protein NifB